MFGLWNYDNYDLWTPADLKRAYTDTFFQKNGRLYSTYPVPTPPDEYSETYQPDYLIITSIEESEVLERVQAMDEAIDEDVAHFNQSAAIAMVIGLVVVLGLVIPLVINALTKPLNWMGKVADKITSNAGGDLGSGLDPSEEPDGKCSPNTEVTDLVTGRLLLCRLGLRRAATSARS